MYVDILGKEASEGDLVIKFVSSCTSKIRLGVIVGKSVWFLDDTCTIPKVDKVKNVFYFYKVGIPSEDELRIKELILKIGVEK